MKICSSCHKEKDCFGKDKSRKDGLNVYCKDCLRSFRLDHIEERRFANLEWQSNNKDKHNKSNRRWRKKHPLYNVQLRKSDINYWLSENLRSRLYQALKSNQKNGSAVDDLGCSIDELKSYLESKFELGMSWDNYGFYGWHIDHIKSLASFDLTNREQFLEACHYTNLQPMWAKENISKGNR